MNWKYYLGSKTNSAVQFILSRHAFPLIRVLPHGKNWLYDTQRFAATKDFRVVFDVGANIGQTAKGLVMYFPSASIFCFEPVSSSFSVLVRKYGKFPNVRCLQKALGSSISTAQMKLHKNSELNTLVHNDPRSGDLTSEVEKVSIDTVDSFCISEVISYIDILKMDVQGWEIEVLRGARKMIEERRIRYVLSEVGFRRADSDMQHIAELNEFMEENGFWLCGFYDSFRWGKHKEFVGFANALYLNPDFTAA